MAEPVRKFLGLTLLAAALCWALPAAGQENDQVIRTYEKALAGNPDDLGIRYNLASAYYERGLFSRAVEQYREIAKLSPDDMAPFYNIGLILYHQREYAQALEAFNRAHQLAQQDDNILYVMGMCHLALENYDQAITAMDMAVKLNPDNIDALINLANSYANSSQYEKAVGLYRDILQRVGKDEFVRKNFGSALYNAGLEHFLKEEYDAALVYLKESFSYIQDRRKAYLLAANSEFNMERYRNAIGLYRLVLEDDPQNIDAHYYLAYSYLMVDSLIPAQKEFDEVLAVNPEHSKALKFKAELLDENFSRTIEKVILAYQQRNYVDAWLRLREAEEMVPGHENVRKYRELLQARIDTVIAADAAEGDRLFSARKYAESLARYRRVLELDPMQFAVQARADSAEAVLQERFRPVYEQAETALQEERYYDAVTGFESVAAVLPGYRNVRKQLREARGMLARESELLYEAGAARCREKDYRQAVEQFDRLLALNPGFADSAGVIAGARTAYKRIKSEKEAQIAALLKAGRDDISAGRFWEAQESFGQLLKLEPGNAEAKRLLAQAGEGISRQIEATLNEGLESFRAQKFMTAAGHFQKVLKLDPGNGDAARYGKICRAILMAREAGTYAGQKKFAKAIATYRKARELDQDNQMVRDGLARAVSARDTEVARLLATGDELMGARRYREAGEAYREILEDVSPGNAEAADRLRRLDQQRRGQDERADVDALYSNGVGHYTRGEYQLAVEAWEKVLQIDPDHEKARRNIVNARRKLDFMKNDK